MNLTATLRERLAAQTERRAHGLPLQKGDLVYIDGVFVPIVDGASAGDCIEYQVEKEIRRVRSERRPPQEE